MMDPRALITADELAHLLAGTPGHYADPGGYARGAGGDPDPHHRRRWHPRKGRAAQQLPDLRGARHGDDRAAGGRAQLDLGGAPRGALMPVVHSLEARLADARARFPVGARVLYRPVMGWPGQEETVVRSSPWALGHGAIVVKIAGRTGGVLVSHLTPVSEAAE